MAALFERRMCAVADVARYKAETGKPVFDAAREAAVLDKNTARITDEALRPYYRAFFSDAMAFPAHTSAPGWAAIPPPTKACPARGATLRCAAFSPLRGSRPAPPGARSLTPCRTGMHNSAFCRLKTPTRAMSPPCSTCCTPTPILSLPGCATCHPAGPAGRAGRDAGDGQDRHQPPQALAQSSVFVQQHGFKTSTWGNTADAARHVAELNDPSVAAIASAETAELYGLQILSPGINADGDNTTRFIVIERAAAAPAMTGEGQRLALLFTARHKPGQLAAALDQIGARGFNMECIKSRPLPHVPFEYYFYVQLVCPAGSTGAECQALLDTLTPVCSTLRLLGAFTLDSTEK